MARNDAQIAHTRPGLFHGSYVLFHKIIAHTIILPPKPYLRLILNPRTTMFVGNRHICMHPSIWLTRKVIHKAMQLSSIIVWSNSDVYGPFADAARNDMLLVPERFLAVVCVWPYGTAHVALRTVLCNTAWVAPVVAVSDFCLYSSLVTTNDVQKSPRSPLKSKRFGWHTAWRETCSFTIYAPFSVCAHNNCTWSA